MPTTLHAQASHPVQPIDRDGAGKAPAPTVLVKDFQITGNTVLTDEELALITCCHLDEELEFDDLQKIADAVTEAYKARGYTLAVAYIPQQEIRDGVVEIAVLEGLLCDIKVTGNQFYSTDFIRKGFAQVINERAIKHSSLERSLLLLNEYRDLKVSATLEPGESTGSTALVARVEDRRPIHLDLDYNNFGVNAISRNRFGAGLEVGNALIEGSQLALRGIIGNEPDRLQFYLASYVLPVNDFGTKLILSGSSGRFDVGGELAVLNITGKIKTYDASVTHPVLKSRFQSLLVDVGFASKDNRLFLLDQVSGNDSIRLLKAGFAYDSTDNQGRTFLSLYGFQGIGKVLGGMSNNDPLATRQGADNRFTKAVLTFERIQSIGSDVFLVLRGNGQISTGPLVIIEQMLLGGPDSVRGYQLGERIVDEGYTLNLEYRTPTYFDWAQWVFFLDHGGGRLRNPVVGEQKSVNLTGAGLGIRMNLPIEYPAMLRVDLGFPIDPGKATGGTLAGGSSPTLYLQMATRF